MTSEHEPDDCPELPQYGNLITYCQAKLPQDLSRWLKVLLGFVILVLVTIVFVVSHQQFAGNPIAQGGFVALALASVAGIAYLSVQHLARMQYQPVFVFDGGIHLNERVMYTVPGGHRISLYRGVRQVSLPWRVLSELTLTESSTGGRAQREASLRLPDGRTMRIAAADGPECVSAIQLLVDRLKGK